MKIRFGLLLGFVAGYVLGARAGRERYAQIVALWDKLAGTPQAQQFTEEARSAAQNVASAAQSKAAEGVTKATEQVSKVGDAAAKQDPEKPRVTPS